MLEESDWEIYTESDLQLEMQSVDGLQRPVATTSLVPVAAPRFLHSISALVGKGTKSLEAIVSYLKDKMKSHPTPCFEEDLKPDFMSTCEAVIKRLFLLTISHKTLFSLVEIQEHGESARQFREKQILISFVGRLNVGKSTLLNAILGARLLPMKKEAETGIRVQIHHDAQDSRPAATTSSNQHPKLLLKKGKQGQPEEVVGVTEIYRRLETLNKHVRKPADHENHEEVYCTLKTSVPLLVCTLPNWQVVLVDTPGAGDSNTHVAVAAKGALKSSSAYVFVTTYDAIESAENTNFIQFLHDHDQGIFENKRLIIVVTCVDHLLVPDGTGEEITAQKVQEHVCQSVKKACPHAKISHDDVLPLFGLWAYHARMLATCHPEEPEYTQCRKWVEYCLSQYQSLPRGQGESQSSCFSKLRGDELAKQLLDVSGFTSLEAMIRNITKSCIKVWVSKVKGDYERHLTLAKNRLWMQLDFVFERQMKQEKEHTQVHQYLCAIDAQWHEVEDTMKSKVWPDLDEMYPKDLEASEALKRGKELLQKGVEDFELECSKKVKDKQVQYGPDDLENDLKEFLKKMSMELDKLFNHTCAFPGLNQVLRDHGSKIAGVVATMRGNAELLCTTLQQKPLEVSQEKTAVEARKKENSSELLMKPSLGYIKKKVTIPPVSLTWWSQIAQFFSNLFAPLWKSRDKAKATDCNTESGDGDGSEEDECDHKGAAAKPSKSSSYRSWDKELKDVMGKLREHLEEECDDYLKTKVKQQTLKYFHDEHCQETRAHLEAFSMDYKAKLDEAKRKLKELKRKIEKDAKILIELKALHDHLLKLKDHLCIKAGCYVSDISK